VLGETCADVVVRQRLACAETGSTVGSDRRVDGPEAEPEIASTAIPLTAKQP
jgi:hypothetical protein